MQPTQVPLDIADVLRVRAPKGDCVPILFDVPHAGRTYPDDFGSCLPLTKLRRAEDAFVDLLVDNAPLNGITVVEALFPRAYIDPNRGENDLDPALLSEPWPGPAAPTVKSDMGIGLIRRHVIPGQSIYDRKLSAAEVRDRIEGYWLPYRQAVTSQLASLQERFGSVLYVQWHSMKSVGNGATPDGAGMRRPDIVLGDLHGASAGASTTAMLRDAFAQRGLRVRINQPYAGGDMLAAIGDPARGIDGVQVEINRRLYLDEDAVELNDGAAALQRAIDGVSEVLAERFSMSLRLSRTA